MISFDVGMEEFDIICEIADRAIELMEGFGHTPPEKMTLVMDLSATHANGCPLKLRELLDAERGTFAHDVGGIIKHINRETGQLEDCFVPRLARSNDT